MTSSDLRTKLIRYIYMQDRDRILYGVENKLWLSIFSQVSVRLHTMLWDRILVHTRTGIRDRVLSSCLDDRRLRLYAWAQDKPRRLP